MTHISKPAQFETGEPDLGPTVNCNKYADMTLEPERDNPNDICTKLAQHVQVAHKTTALSSDWSAPYASSNAEYNILRRKLFVRGDTEHALSP